MNAGIVTLQRERRALLIHGNIYGFGGAENHAVRVAAILQRMGCRVDVAHAGPVLDAEKVFAWCGIRLDPARVRFLTVWPFRRVPGLARGLVLLQYAIVLRCARAFVRDYDLAIGPFGEVPIHDDRILQSLQVPLFFHDEESLAYLGVRATRGPRLLARKLYVGMCRWIAGWNRRAVSAHPSLCNSEWTARQFARHYPDGNFRALHLGATTLTPYRQTGLAEFQRRASNFVVLGRVAPFKRIEVAIRIIDTLRERGHEVGLIIIGSGDGAYGQAIAELVRSRPHVQWMAGLSRSEMESTIAAQRWGLHCAMDEHYGLAAVEMIRLGCIVFVPDSGGQVEVVTDARLRYTDDLAVPKIEAVLTSDSLQSELLGRMPEVVAQHDVDRHAKLFSEFVAGFLATRGLS